MPPSLNVSFRVTLTQRWNEIFLIQVSSSWSASDILTSHEGDPSEALAFEARGSLAVYGFDGLIVEIYSLLLNIYMSMHVRVGTYNDGVFWQ